MQGHYMYVITLDLSVLQNESEALDRIFQMLLFTCR